MSKKLLNLLLSFILIGILLPSVSLAVAGIYQAKDGTSICYEGLVPCGLGKPCWENSNPQGGKCAPKKDNLIKTNNKPGVSCQFCHFFVMINGIVNFILINVVPYLAVLMLVAGGIMFYFGGGKPDLLNRGKKLITGVIIGLFLIYGSYMIVGVFLQVLGASEWSGLTNWAAQGPFSINCEIEIP